MATKKPIKATQKKSEEKQVVTPVVEPTSPVVSFTVWYSMRAPKIPKFHPMNVIKADFESRGLSENETMETFDESLKKYGININN